MILKNDEFDFFCLQAKLNQTTFGLRSFLRKRKLSTNSNISLSTNSTSSISTNSISASHCSNSCIKKDEYEISQDALNEIVAFESFLEQFHRRQQQKSEAKTNSKTTQI